MDSVVGNWDVEELINRCSQRPADEAAWQEFVRRFHLTIRTNVSNVLARLVENEQGANVIQPGETIQELVQNVYLRLTENDGAALKRASCTETSSMKNYLLLIAINVVRDHFRHGAPAVQQIKPSRSLSREEFLTSGGFAVVKSVS
jgi:DNA-directed RNA polymerase specialized sigma24 family protein